ncbi:MAG: Urease accessory protein [Nitrosopumilus sp.]|nr:Urease accessory protein [Nitrosopumilus sp.]
MLEVHAPIGNIFEEEFKDLQNGDSERLRISRIELEKRILRKQTDCGTDLGFKLDPGVRLRHGDIIKNKDSKIIVEQLPERVISVKFKENTTSDVKVLLGHMIGNMHRPISIRKEEVLIPILADSERDTFSKIIGHLIDHIELKIDQRVFISQSGVTPHEH